MMVNNQTNEPFHGKTTQGGGLEEEDKGEEEDMQHLTPRKGHSKANAPSPSPNFERREYDSEEEEEEEDHNYRRHLSPNTKAAKV